MARPWVGHIEKNHLCQVISLYHELIREELPKVIKFDNIDPLTTAMFGAPHFIQDGNQFIVCLPPSPPTHPLFISKQPSEGGAAASEIFAKSYATCMSVAKETTGTQVEFKGHLMKGLNGVMLR